LCRNVINYKFTLGWEFLNNPFSNWWYLNQNVVTEKDSFHNSLIVEGKTAYIMKFIQKRVPEIVDKSWWYSRQTEHKWLL